MTSTFTLPDREPDFEDCFRGPNANPQLTAKQLAQVASDSSPLWFRVLFSVRQRIAALLGLVTEVENSSAEQPEAAQGFIFQIPCLQNTPDVFEAGLHDKHLDFALSVEKHDDEVSLSTRIWFNSLLGRIYLFFVKPFHNMIVSHWLKNLGKPA